jgi:hypothetical protein
MNPKRSWSCSGDRVAGATRLRPVCMTAPAMIIGMLPMALSLGSGGEQNAPIGRAVIGGLLFATVGTLLIVPVFYSLFASGCATSAVTDRERRAAGSGLGQRGQAGDRYIREL